MKAWNTIIKETENVIQLIRDNAEKLVAKTLERLVQVINEKKAAKKFYGDEHSRLESDFAKVPPPTPLILRLHPSVSSARP